MAILSGEFDDTDARVIGTSIGFAVLSTIAASGASLRFRQPENLRALGLLTMVLSGATFLLLCGAIWTDDDGELWQWFGCVGLAALACSHASLVTGALRPGDSPTVRALSTASGALAAADASFGILAISEAVDRVDDAVAQLVAVLVILLVLTTVLPPVMRRLQRPAAAVAVSPPSDMPGPPLQLAAEVLAAIDRIEALNADPGNRSPEIRRECERLRQMIRAYES